MNRSELYDYLRNLKDPHPELGHFARAMHLPSQQTAESREYSSPAQNLINCFDQFPEACFSPFVETDWIISRIAVVWRRD